MNRITISQAAGTVGIKQHQVRHLIEVHRIPASGQVSNAAVYHPWLIDWLRGFLADRDVLAKRKAVRTKRLLAEIAKVMVEPIGEIIRQADELAEAVRQEFDLPEWDNDGEVRIPCRIRKVPAA